MKKLRENLQLNNRGVSLVELIVSVLILAVIFLPTYTAFNTAMKVNLKAKHISQAEAVASNVMEEVAYMGFAGMKQQAFTLDGSGNPVANTAADYKSTNGEGGVDGVWTFVNNPDKPASSIIKAGDGDYTVRVTYTAKVSRDGTDVDDVDAANNFNTYKFADISDLNKNGTVLINPAVSGTDYDNVAADHFYLLHTSYEDRTANLSWSQIKSKITKRMYLVINRDTTYVTPENPNEIYYVLNSYLEYTLTGSTGVVAPGGSQWILTGYCDNISVDELKSLYLLYKPISSTATDANGTYINWSFGDESVNIVCVNMTDPIKVYVVVQADPQTDIRGTLYMNVSDPSLINVKSQAATSMDGVAIANANAALGTSSVEAITRIYDVLVEVYEAGKTEVLTSLSSTVTF